MFTLRQLEVFDATARLGSVSEAADELAMTQPAASMALQQLESALGTELFVRVQRRLVLSHQGKLLQPLARSMLNSAQEIQTLVNAKVFASQLRIGASPTIGDHMLDRLCSGFMAQHPGVRLSVTILPAFDVINRVDEMALDIGLIEFISVRPTLDVIRWRDEALTVFCSPKNPLALRKKVAVAELAEQRWCLQHRFADSRRQFTLELLKRVPSIDITLESDSVPVLIKAVEDDIGISCLPRPCIAQELKDGRLCELNVSGLDLSIPLSIVSHKLVKRGEMHARFIEAVLNHAGV